MQVRVKTEPYKQNSYCSHLVEHCVFSGYQSIDNFFEVDMESSWTSRLWYTKFYIPDHKNIDKFISHITAPIDSKVIAKEKKIIREETEDDQKNTGNLLINKIWKILYGSLFKRYPTSWLINIKEVSDYHKHYYQHDNIWILDDNFAIQQRPQKTIKKYTDNRNHKIAKTNIKVEWKTFCAYIVDYTSGYDYTLCYFLDWLYTNSAAYLYRYIGEEYYPPIAHFFEFPDKLTFIRRYDYPLDISEEFFIKAKKSFLNNPVNINEIRSVNEILKLETISTAQIKKIISWFSYSLIKQFLEN